MKTYYSIIKVVPNSLVGDAISIGMILSDDNSFFIRFSNSKIRIAKTLLGDKKKLLDFFISKIEESFTKINITDKEMNLFHFPDKINSQYLSYLHKYNNNVIQYGEPKYIAESNTSNTFDALFSLMIENENLYKEKSISVQAIKTLENINKKLIERVKHKVHTNIKFTDKIIPSLYFNYEMDCIGLNGVFTAAKSINFNQSELTIQKEVSNYYAISSMLENLKGKYGKENNFYLISDEPDNIGSKEHMLWEKLRKGIKFKLIYSEEADIVAEKIEETNAGMFLPID